MKQTLAFITSSVIMHTLDFQQSYTCITLLHMYILHVYSTCIFHMYIPHVYSTCIFYMYIPHIYSTCIFYMYILHVYSTCIFYMYIKQASVHNIQVCVFSK